MITSWIYRHWTLFTLALLGPGLVWIGLTAAQTPPTTQGQVPAPRPGFLAPPFSLTTLTGETVSLEALRGKVVVLNIWTTWCAFCETEMPAFQNAFESFQSRSDIVILAMNSTAQDDPLAVRQFVDRKGLQFSIPLDSDGHITRLYLLQALPTTFFIDRDGMIRDVIIGGPLTAAMIESRATALVNQRP